MLKVIRNIISRIEWHLTPFTVLEIAFILITYPLVKYAAPEFFMENGWIENLQLVILAAAVVIALTAKNEKPLFVFCAMIIFLLFLREADMGRSYFCAKYLKPGELCKWSSFKYAYIIDIIRLVYALMMIFYALKHKIWQPLWKYLSRAPIYIWEILFMMIGIIGGVVAELRCCQNEIFEESAETLMYAAAAYLIWRYAHLRLKN